MFFFSSLVYLFIVRSHELSKRGAMTTADPFPPPQPPTPSSRAEHFHSASLLSLSGIDPSCQTSKLPFLKSRGL